MDLQLDQFKIGDILSLVGEVEELHIEKIWLSKQGSYKWVDYETRTHTSQRPLALSVEYDDGEWEALCYDRFPAPEELPGAESLPQTLSWEGMTFRRQEQGRCVMRLVSAPGEDLQCSYADYSGPDGAALSVELFGDPQSPDMPPEVEIYAGRQLRSTDLRLYAPIDLEPRNGMVLGNSTRLSTKPAAGSAVPVKLIAGAAALLLLIVVLVVLL